MSLKPKERRAKNEFVTTNLRLPKERLRELRLRAVNEGESLAELIRQAIDAYLGYRQSKSRKKNIKDDPFFKIIDLGSDGITDGSVNHDYYLYGMPKKSRK